ncbi:hypothetical protein ABZZ79_30845 [Streptomyces sp. NPDC006458]|uniref:hypothetical protein n=1 Tax=Streptomyces sp. NPDC006458 TaxID=3154302 RepID=UPI0033A5071C
MTRRAEQRVTADRLGIRPEAGAWCTIGKTPQPPADVLRAAGNPRLRHAGPGPLGVLAMVLAAPFLAVLMLLKLLSEAEEAVKRSLGTKDEKERRRAEQEDERRRDALLAQRGLDQVFDGDWQGDAGQLLLRWYSRSTHPERLVLATQEGIVLAAPPRRVTVGREKRMQVVGRIPADEAALVDPLSGEFETTCVLLSFRDGSWLRVDTEEPRSDLHMYLIRQPRPGN